MQETLASDFIQAIEKELKAGYGFIVLAGTGLSASAGIPVIDQLSGYLQRCVALAIGVDILDIDSRDQHRRWRPRSDNWPHVADNRRPLGTDWFLEVDREFRKRTTATIWDREAVIFQEALGDLADWRSSLLFLSRICTRYIEPDQRESLYFDAPSQDVVDSFFRHVTVGHAPSLSHNMLVALCPLLRCNTILTTNFDDLIENSLVQLGHTAKVFDIHLSSRLPRLGAVPIGWAIVKLHGSRYSIRADYSLDAPPPDEDCHAFLEYLAGQSFKSDAISDEREVRNHVLLMGHSVADKRIAHLLRVAIKRFNDRVKLFWICYTDRDVDTARTFATELNSESVYPLRYPDLGLGLLHLHQVLAHSLPPARVIFPSTSRLPLPPTLIAQHPLNTFGRDKSRQLRDRIATVQHRLFPGHRLVIVCSSTSVHGVTSIAAEVYDELRQSSQTCLWLDLNDIVSTDDLFEQLLDAVWYATGTDEWMPMYLERHPERRAQEIRRATDNSVRKWVIFLNAREMPGSNLYKGYDPTTHPNGWFDNTETDAAGKHSRDNTACAEQALKLLLALAGPKCPNVTVVALCRGTESPFLNAVKARGAQQQSGFAHSTWIQLDQLAVDDFNIERNVQLALDWAGDDLSKHKFLHALTLMQRTRFLATFFSPAFGGDKLFAERRDDGTMPDGCPPDLDNWLAALERHYVVRRKAGGFIWLHTAIRDRISDIYTCDVQKLSTDALLLAENRKLLTTVQDARDKIATEVRNDNMRHPHLLLAEWYRTVFVSSHRPGAVFEALYHASRAAEAMVLMNTCDALERAIHVVKRAHTFLADSERIVCTTGFSRSSCRRLTAIQQQMHEVQAKAERHTDHPTIRAQLRDAIINICAQCLTTMRGIAREVSEHVTCFHRHRQLCRLYLTGKEDDRSTSSDRGKGFFSEMVSFYSDGDSLTMHEALRDWSLGYRRGQARGSPEDMPREWLYIRWFGVLGGINSAARDYLAAERAFSRALTCLLPDEARPPLVIATSCHDSGAGTKTNEGARIFEHL